MLVDILQEEYGLLQERDFAWYTNLKILLFTR